jgi:hypothetical protein
MNFITGNKFKKICDYIFDENGLHKTEINNKILIFFVKTDLIDLFYSKYIPNYPFKLITHNSDYPITENHLKYLDNKLLVSWYAQNVNFKHEKLKSIPIGIANEIWPHGNESVLINEIGKNRTKNNLIYCNFDIKTNFYERNKCILSMNRNNLNMVKKTNFETYISELSSSFFCLSPNGNGIDCHKTWESIYLKTIPVVTESINMEFYRDYPVYIIKSWDDFNINDLHEDLYSKIIKGYDLKKINIDYYYEVIKN